MLGIGWRYIMSSIYPSIFNDVIGPVMRGPSSSHAAGGARIGELIRQAAGGGLRSVEVFFDPEGALAESHDGHGTDMGFALGILGRSLTEEGAENWQQLIADSGIDLKYTVRSYGAEHPGNYRIHAVSKTGKVIDADAVSTGGGMVELTRLNGYRVSVRGDYDEIVLLTFQDNTDSEIVSIVLSAVPDAEEISADRDDVKTCIDIKIGRPADQSEATLLCELFATNDVVTFSPFLPSRSHANIKVPFRTVSEMLEYNRDRDLKLWQLAVIYESAFAGWDRHLVWDEMEDLVDVMERSVRTGLDGTDYEDRILPRQSHLIELNKDRLVPGDVFNTAIRYITAIMETKSSMGVFVAAPTAGSAGCLAGTVLAVQDALGLPPEQAVKGLFAAGLIGVFFAGQATFSAEVGGCQAECGAGSAMAAAAVTEMMGGSAEECIDAASFALQGLTGLACDPVANRVEVPCLNKNIAGGMNALSSANVILAGYDKVIPLDEAIGAVMEIGRLLPLELRCTCGGLGKTQASEALRTKLDNKSDNLADQ